MELYHLPWKCAGYTHTRTHTPLHYPIINGDSSARKWASLYGPGSMKLNLKAHVMRSNSPTHHKLFLPQTIRESLGKSLRASVELVTQVTISRRKKMLANSFSKIFISGCLHKLLESYDYNKFGLKSRNLAILCNGFIILHTAKSPEIVT